MFIVMNKFYHECIFIRVIMVKMILKMAKMILIRLKRKAAGIPFEMRGVTAALLNYYLLVFNTTVNVNIIVSGL